MGVKGHGKYTADWPDIAREVKEDAGWKCVRCEHKHDPSAGYCLTVHHFDGNKGNMDRWNLMALCQRCHLTVQAKANPRDQLMFDPSAWALPYVAGAYSAGVCLPNPQFDLMAWILHYESTLGKTWPKWAPT